MKEVFDVSFENCHENSFQYSFEDQSDRVLDELHFEQHDYGKQMIKRSESCHVFYDCIGEYMGRLLSQDGRLCVCNYGLDHQEEEEDSRWDVSLCLLNSEIILPYSIEEHGDISFEILERNQV